VKRILNMESNVIIKLRNLNGTISKKEFYQGLEHIYIDCDGAETIEGIEELQKCKNLNSLRITNVKQLGNLLGLEKCKNLQSLTILRVKKLNLLGLKKLYNLNYLDISVEKLLGRGFEVLKESEFIGKLKSLSLSQFKLHQEDLDILNYTNNLEKLHLGRNSLQEINLDFIKNNNNIKSITISGQDLLALDLSPLSKCQELNFLMIFNSKIEQIDLNYLSNCQKLELIDFRDNNIKEIDLSFLKNLQNLKRLRFSRNKKDFQIKNLQNIIRCEELIEIDLSGHGLSQINLNLFTKLKKLTRISVVGNKLTKFHIIFNDTHVNDNQIMGYKLSIEGKHTQDKLDFYKSEIFKKIVKLLRYPQVDKFILHENKKFVKNIRDHIEYQAQIRDNPILKYLIKYEILSYEDLFEIKSPKVDIKKDRRAYLFYASGIFVAILSYILLIGYIPAKLTQENWFFQTSFWIFSIFLLYQGIAIYSYTKSYTKKVRKIFIVGTGMFEKTKQKINKFFSNLISEFGVIVAFIWIITVYSLYKQFVLLSSMGSTTNIFDEIINFLSEIKIPIIIHVFLNSIVNFIYLGYIGLFIRILIILTIFYQVYKKGAIILLKPFKNPSEYFKDKEQRKWYHVIFLLIGLLLVFFAIVYENTSNSNVSTDFFKIGIVIGGLLYFSTNRKQHLICLQTILFLVLIYLSILLGFQIFERILTEFNQNNTNFLLILISIIPSYIIVLRFYYGWWPITKSVKEDSLLRIILKAKSPYHKGSIEDDRSFLHRFFFSENDDLTIFYYSPHIINARYVNKLMNRTLELTGIKKDRINLKIENLNPLSIISLSLVFFLIPLFLTFLIVSLNTAILPLWPLWI